MHYLKQVLLRLIILFAAVFFTCPVYAKAEETEILDLDLSSLMQIQITSAGRKEQKLLDVPAAVYVIHQDDIKNSGATYLPELLRLVPGLQVARISAGKWAITSRGFNGTFSNKLLVQIDGRSIYSPAYSGVYWDMQAVMLEDIERIEIIRGPGATLWGANAVNGVINIITKEASNSLGIIASGTLGDHETGTASLRYGKQFSNDLYGRIYFNHHSEDSFTYLSDESDAHDDWGISSGGFRLDSDIGLRNSWTLQGDLYEGKGHQQVYPYWAEGALLPQKMDDTIDLNGYNITGRWQHRYSEKNAMTFQFYANHTDRQEIYIGQKHNTIDLDFQHRFQFMKRNDIVWGIGYRTIDDKFNNTYMASIRPDSKRLNLFSGFIQDEINLISNTLWLTLGTKIEHNEYTDTEVQPSARFLWKPNHVQSVWASVSRAVRTPSRAEDSSQVVMRVTSTPPYQPVYAYGNETIDAEEVLCWETGYRYSSDTSFSFDATLFYNEYDNLLDFIQTDPVSIHFMSNMEGRSYGFELSTQYQPFEWLEAEINYSYIALKMSSASSLAVTNDIVTENSSPQHQVFLKTAFDLSKNLRWNVLTRYVDELKIPSAVAYQTEKQVDAYMGVDTNIIWSPIKNLEVMFAAQNLTDSDHLEFINEYFTPAVEIERSFYLKLTWKQ